MSSFDYNAPAELFLSKPAKGSRTKYRRFATAAEALRYAVEDLRTPKAFGAWLEVGDERFNSSEIQRLYEGGAEELVTGSLVKLEVPGLRANYALHATARGSSSLVIPMTSITYLNGSANEKNEAVRLCRKKATECQRTALTTPDPIVRLRFLHLAKLWREMADEADQRTNKPPMSEDKGVIIVFPKRLKADGDGGSFRVGKNENF